MFTTRDLWTGVGELPEAEWLAVGDGVAGTVEQMALWGRPDLTAKCLQLFCWHQLYQVSRTGFLPLFHYHLMHICVDVCARVFVYVCVLRKEVSCMCNWTTLDVRNVSIGTTSLFHEETRGDGAYFISRWELKLRGLLFFFSSLELVPKLGLNLLMFKQERKWSHHKHEITVGTTIWSWEIDIWVVLVIVSLHSNAELFATGPWRTLTAEIDVWVL